MTDSTVEALFQAHEEHDTERFKELEEKIESGLSPLQKAMWVGMGALPLLTIWAMWLTNAQLEESKTISTVERLEIEAAVIRGVDAALDKRLELIP